MSPHIMSPVKSTYFSSSERKISKPNTQIIDHGGDTLKRTVRQTRATSTTDRESSKSLCASAWNGTDRSRPAPAVGGEEVKRSPSQRRKLRLAGGERKTRRSNRKLNGVADLRVQHEILAFVGAEVGVAMETPVAAGD